MSEQHEDLSEHQKVREVLLDLVYSLTLGGGLNSQSLRKKHYDAATERILALREAEDSHLDTKVSCEPHGSQGASSSLTNKLKDIYRRCDVSNNGTDEPLGEAEAITAILTALREEGWKPSSEWLDRFEKELPKDIVINDNTEGNVSFNAGNNHGLRIAREAAKRIAGLDQ